MTEKHEKVVKDEGSDMNRKGSLHICTSFLKFALY